MTSFRDPVREHGLIALIALNRLIDTIRREEGDIVISHVGSEWTIGCTFGSEAEDSPMAGGATYGVGASYNEAMHRSVEDLGVERGRAPGVPPEPDVLSALHRAARAHPGVRAGLLIANALDPNRTDRPPLDLLAVTDEELVQRLLAYARDGRRARPETNETKETS